MRNHCGWVGIDGEKGKCERTGQNKKGNVGILEFSKAKGKERRKN